MVMHILLFLLLAVCCAMGREDMVTDPEIDFVTNSFLFQTVSQKATIVRKDIDIDGSGNMAIFMRPSVGGGRGGEYWTAYIPRNGGVYQRYEDLQFREDTFHAGKIPNFSPDGGILAYCPAKGGGDLILILFEPNRTNTLKLRSMDFSTAEDQNIFREIFGRKFDDVLPAEYFKNPQHLVINTQDVMVRAQTAHSQGESQEEASGNTDSKAPIINHTIPSSKTPGAKAQENNKGQSESTSGVLWAVVVMIVVGGFWLITKKRN